MRYSLYQPHIADAIENAVNKTLLQGYRTQDLALDKQFVSTDEMGSIIASHIMQEV